MTVAALSMILLLPLDSIRLSFLLEKASGLLLVSKKEVKHLFVFLLTLTLQFMVHLRDERMMLW